MGKNTEIHIVRHCFFNLHVHLVFVTKYRRGVFNTMILDDLHRIFSKVCCDFEAELTEFDGEEDHMQQYIEQQNTPH